MSDRTEIIAETIADNNRDALRRLTRIVTRSQGFSLSIALSNYRVLQRRILQDLRSQLAENGLPETAIAILELEPDAKTLLAPIQELMGKVHRLPTEQKPKVLMVLGLDAVTEIEAVLKSANRVREEFANCLEFPMVLWLNDRTQDILTREASDLANWTTAGAIAFRLEVEELKELVQASTEAMFDLFLNLSNRKSLQSAIASGLQQFELRTAVTELETETVIDLELMANLDFAFGCIAFTASQISQAKELLQKSLVFWQSENQLKQAVCLLQLGMCDRAIAFRSRFDKEPFYRKSQQYFTHSIAIFRQIERWDLVAEYINFLTVSIEELASLESSTSLHQDKENDDLWAELESLASEALVQHQTYPNQLREANDRGILAAVRLFNADYATARQFAESAVALYQDAADLKLPNLSFSERYLYGKYELWLAKALAGMDDRQGAIARLEGVRDRWRHQYDARIYVTVLEELRSLYTSAGLYLEAFETKQHQRSVEQQYGLRAFIGAGTLNPRREDSNPDMYASISFKNDGIAQEIEASGRMQDVQNLMDRIGQARFPLTVVHGDSGAGKSSILSGGVIPALRLRESFDGRKVVVLAVKTYKDWSAEIRRQLQEYFPDRDADIDPIHHFKLNIEANYLTVLIFDQFEDFFFKKEDFHDRLPFYRFLKASLYIDFVQVVLSMREDYLYYLLEFDRSVKVKELPKDFEGDILGKQVRYYLGDFTQEQARQVIEALTKRSQLRLEPELIDRLVTDLSGEQLRILPIELQVVGAQLESENPPISTLQQYLALTGSELGGAKHRPDHHISEKGRKPSEVLVERWLENVVRDCGVANQVLAERVLYALTGNEEKRPQKTQAELALELLGEVSGHGLGFRSPLPPLQRGALDALGSIDNSVPLSKGDAEGRGIESLNEAENLSLVLAVLVGSGLAFRVSSSPDDRFQLIHDYLVSFIRKKYRVDVMAELREERKRRELAEKEKEIYAVANRKAKQRIWIASIFLGIASVAAIGISIYAGKTFIEQQEAIAGTRLEREGSVLLKQFEFQELKTLVAAVRVGNELRSIAKDRSLELYPAVSPILALQNSLTKMHEKTFINADIPAIVINGSVSQLISFSPDGKMLATSGSDGIARIWDLEGKEIAKLQGHQGGGLSVIFSADGKMLATSGSDGTARIWDLNGKEIAKLVGHQGEVLSVIFSADDKKLATIGSDGTARIWNLEGKEIVKLVGHQGTVSSVVFSADGKMLATSGSDRTARIWDLEGKEIAKLVGHQEAISSVVFSADGKMLATSSRDGTARIWDLEGKEIVKLVGHQGAVSSVVFSADGKMLATSGRDGTARIWDLEGKEIVKLVGHQGEIFRVVFSADGKMLATSGSDGIARIWDLEGKEIAKLVGHQGVVSSVVFSADGKMLATSGSEGTVRIWDLEGKEIAKLKGHQGVISSVVFSADEKMLATSGSDGTVRIWDLEGREIAKLKGHQGNVLSITFSPDGKILATSGIDKTVRIWNVEGKEIAKLQGQGYVLSVVFSPDSKRIATSDETATRIWDLEGKEIAKPKGHLGNVLSIAFSPDGKKIATSGRDGTARIWDLEGKEIAKLQGHLGDFFKMVFSPDSKNLATSGIINRTAKIWDLEGKEIAKLQGNVWNVVFSPDGRKIATSGRDGTARIWNLEGKEIAKLQGQGYVLSVVFSPDSKRIATSGSGGTARIWDLQGRQIAEYQGLGYISKDFQFIATIPTDDRSIAKLWRIQTLDEMLDSACARLRPYLTNNPDVSESDKHLCDK